MGKEKKTLVDSYKDTEPTYDEEEYAGENDFEENDCTDADSDSGGEENGGEEVVDKSKKTWEEDGDGNEDMVGFNDYWNEFIGEEDDDGEDEEEEEEKEEGGD